MVWRCAAPNGLRRKAGFGCMYLVVLFVFCERSIVVDCHLKADALLCCVLVWGGGTDREKEARKSKKQDTHTREGGRRREEAFKVPSRIILSVYRCRIIISERILKLSGLILISCVCIT